MSANKFSESDHALARRLAQATGALLLALRQDTNLSGHALGAAGDQRANDLLLRELAQHRPDDAVLSEESHDNRQRLQAARVWIIDPLDGTREYREGRDDWAVHVALVSGGVVIAAAVSQPERDEVFDSSDVRLTGVAHRRIVVSRSRPPRFAEALARDVQADVVSMGSAGAKALAVVRGDAIAYVHEGGLNEWDAAAPVGVALAHGLHVSDLRGEPITFNQHDVALHRGLVICQTNVRKPLLGQLREIV